MTRAFTLIAAVLGFLGVALGAFGAHGLQATLDANGHADTFHTATQYHLIHAIALLAVAWLLQQNPQQRLLHWAGWLFTTGVILFSGSLYLLAIFDLSMMGALAPVGGLALLGGWACIAVAAWRQH